MDAFGHKIILNEDLKPLIAVKCMICDNYIALNHREAQGVSLYICSECKDAIKWLKEFMEEKVNDQYDDGKNKQRRAKGNDRD